MGRVVLGRVVREPRYRCTRIIKLTNGIAFHFAACPVTNFILLYVLLFNSIDSLITCWYMELYIHTRVFTEVTFGIPRNTEFYTDGISIPRNSA